MGFRWKIMSSLWDLQFDWRSVYNHVVPLGLKI